MADDLGLPEDDMITTLFNQAANVVQANATGQQSDVKPSDRQLLELYGLYKVATAGPCREPQPGIFNVRGKSKWSAWKEKSDLSGAEAKQEYISQVMSIYDWTPTCDTELTGASKSRPVSGGFAPAVSRPPVPVEDKRDVDTPFGWVKDNNITKINQWIATDNVDINVCDEDGLTLLHWAADRGRAEVCEILLKAGANPEVKDEDEQTPLDYAITCEHEDVIKLLKNHVEIVSSGNYQMDMLQNTKLTFKT